MQLRELIEETLENCAHTLYLLCSSWHLESVPPFLNDLFAPLKELQPNTPFRNSHLSLWISALILISPHNLQKSNFLQFVFLFLTLHPFVLLRTCTYLFCNTSGVRMQKINDRQIPVRCARDLLMEFHKEVILEDWQDSCLQASLQFAVAVSYNWFSVHQLVQEGSLLSSYIHFSNS